MDLAETMMNSRAEESRMHKEWVDERLGRAIMHMEQAMEQLVLAEQRVAAYQESIASPDSESS